MLKSSSGPPASFVDLMELHQSPDRVSEEATFRTASVYLSLRWGVILIQVLLKCLEDFARNLTWIRKPVNMEDFCLVMTRLLPHLYQVLSQSGTLLATEELGSKFGNAGKPSSSKDLSFWLPCWILHSTALHSNPLSLQGAKELTDGCIVNNISIR